MTKFDSRYTAVLYGLTPDDELGQSLDGGSWYGLYRGKSGGNIIVEDTYGFVGRTQYATDAALFLAWAELETEQDLNHGDGELLGEWRHTADHYGVAI